MAEPDLVARCVEVMRGAVSIPITVKTRLGIDDHDSYERLWLVDSFLNEGG
jgi:tRNA-dihydrouridine synthase A